MTFKESQPVFKNLVLISWAMLEVLSKNSRKGEKGWSRLGGETHPEPKINYESAFKSYGSGPGGGGGRGGRVQNSEHFQPFSLYLLQPYRVDVQSKLDSAPVHVLVISFFIPIILFYPASVVKVVWYRISSPNFSQMDSFFAILFFVFLYFFLRLNLCVWTTQEAMTKF